MSQSPTRRLQQKRSSISPPPQRTSISPPQQRRTSSPRVTSKSPTRHNTNRSRSNSPTIQTNLVPTDSIQSLTTDFANLTTDTIHIQPTTLPNLQQETLSLTPSQQQQQQQDIQLQLQSIPTFEQAQELQQQQIDDMFAAKNLLQQQHNQAQQTQKVYIQTQLTPQEIKDFPNYAFQVNLRPSLPDKVLLSTIHSTWADRFDLLEVNHNYIQWLFPLFERGVNYQQPPMTQEEANRISQDEYAKANMRQSFKMMTEFWGFQYDEENCVVTRHPDEKIMIRGFENWMCTHNDLRVSRSLRSLAITGQPDIGFAFLQQLHHECSPTGYPRAVGLRNALDKFWIPIFEKDPVYADRCKVLRDEMDQWPQPKRQGWFF